MQSQLKEPRTVIAIKALETDQRLNPSRVMKIYNVPEATLHNKIKGMKLRIESQLTNQLLGKIEEEVLVQYIVDLDN
jgi:hypothetical protein